MIFREKAPLKEANQFFKGLFQKLQESELSPFIIGSSCCNPDIYLAENIVSETLITNNDRKVDECDTLIVHGVLTSKMVPYLKQCYEKLLEPKHVIGFGTCTVKGYPYNTIKLDEIIPVTIAVEGCSPGAEALKQAINKINGHQDSVNNG